MPTGDTYGDRTRDLLIDNQLRCLCAKVPSKFWGGRRDLHPSLLGHNQPCCYYTTITTFGVLEWTVGLEPTASDLEGRRSAN